MNGARMKGVETAHNRDVTAILYCNEDKCLVTAAWDRKILFHDEEPADICPTMRGLTRTHSRDISAAAFSYPLSLVATGSSDFSIKVR